MDRRRFIHSTCLACVSAITLPALLTACSAARYVTAALDGEDLVIPTTSFLDEQGRPRPYRIVTQDQLKQPIAVFRKEDGSYQAVLMRCTHRAADLQVVGARLECAAHGSVFASDGAVIEGPASMPLRKFLVVERDGLVRISLKA